MAIAARFADAPRALVRGRIVPVASGPRLRLLGLAHLDRELAGPGLWIPRCRSIHTFGMRFTIAALFLDSDGTVLSSVELPPRRVAACRVAAGVLELPLP